MNLARHVAEAESCCRMVNEELADELRSIHAFSMVCMHSAGRVLAAACAAPGGRLGCHGWCHLLAMSSKHGNKGAAWFCMSAENLDA
jgi:hypothetical protein